MFKISEAWLQMSGTRARVWLRRNNGTFHRRDRPIFGVNFFYTEDAVGGGVNSCLIRRREKEREDENDDVEQNRPGMSLGSGGPIWVCYRYTRTGRGRTAAADQRPDAGAINTCKAVREAARRGGGGVSLIKSPISLFFCT